MFNQLYDWSIEYLDYDFVYYFETTIDILCLIPWYFKRFIFAIRCWWFWVYEAEKHENGRKNFIECPYHWSIINEGSIDILCDYLESKH